MVDTVKFTKSITSEESEEICSRLQSGEWVDQRTGEIRVSTLLNGIMWIEIRGLKLTVSGSLSQFYLESYQSLSWNQVSLAISKLERILGLGLRDAIVMRLDIEGTFYLPSSIELYIYFLGEYGRYKRSDIEKSTLYYKTRNKQICFYDKSKEMKKKRRWSVEGYKDNLVRFESRFFAGCFRQLKKKWGINRFTVYHLLDQVYQRKILDLWYKDYQSLHKIPQLFFNLNEISGWAVLKQELLKHAIATLGGIDEVVRMLERGRYTNPNMNSKILSRLKRCLRETGQKELCLIQNQPLHDLNNSVEKVYEKNLQSLQQH